MPRVAFVPLHGCRTSGLWRSAHPPELRPTSSSPLSPSRHLAPRRVSRYYGVHLSRVNKRGRKPVSKKWPTNIWNACSSAVKPRPAKVWTIWYNVDQVYTRYHVRYNSCDPPVAFGNFTGFLFYISPWVAVHSSSAGTSRSAKENYAGHGRRPRLPLHRSSNGGLGITTCRLNCFLQQEQPGDLQQ